ncbi:hypothetical protein QJS10_CPB21g01215 [Acorus calamus]|uniref:Transmembrane protein 209 n=1 Tax=Acorus calamus TaxID=4465 RepID=A0AAV9C6B4_ACOCL|nr:hypothetical protein QJS10_CPB21g01215 [Acorus calamus]
MEADKTPPKQQKPPPTAVKFSVYQNPTLSAALTAKSLQPSASTYLIILFLSSASALSLLSLLSREDRLVHGLASLKIPKTTARLLAKVLQITACLVFVGSLSALLRALSLRHTRRRKVAAAASAAKDENRLTERQLGFMGLRPKPLDEPPKKPPKSRSSPFQSLVPVHKSSSSHTRTPSSAVPPRPSPPSSDWRGGSTSPWSKQRWSSSKGMLTESSFEEFLEESPATVDMVTPQTRLRGFGIASPGSLGSNSAASSGAATRSTPLRTVRMSPASQKYTTPPKKGEGELPLPMSMEEAIKAFEGLGVYPQIEVWRDRLRQWFSSVVLNPLLDKIDTSHVQVMQAAANVGISVNVSQVGSDLGNVVVPAANVSPIGGSKEWQPTFALNEDGVLHQLRAALLQARDGSASSLQYSQQNPLIPHVQACLDAITEYQRLHALLKGELVKELAEGTCIKNYEYQMSGEVSDKANKKWSPELSTDSHLLLYLFCAFLEHPKWMLHVDPASYSGTQPSKNPLFLGVLPPKESFPEKYVAVISGVPSIIHPGACILGRTALWDAILLLCHKIKMGYGGVVRGVHLGSSALSILPVMDPEDED